MFKIVKIYRQENIAGIICREGSGGTIQTTLSERMVLFIWYVSSFNKYSSIADRFGVSESTAPCAIRNLLIFINDYLVERLIVWPIAAELQEMQDLHQSSHNFPGVCGMKDGTHISIRRPSERGIDYFNRKDYYSVILQGVVAEDMRFTNVFAGFLAKCMVHVYFGVHHPLKLVKICVEMDIC